MTTEKTQWFAHSTYVTDKENFRFADDGSRHGDTPNWVLQVDTEENAHLIASAPELMAALEKCITMISGTCDFIHAKPLLDESRSAIAKARGQL